MNFVKSTTFKMGTRTFLILGTHYTKDFPKEQKDVYNFVIFIEIDPNVTYRDEVTERMRYKEYAPVPIKDPKTDEEKYCEVWRKMENTNLRSKSFLLKLIRDGVVVY